MANFLGENSFLKKNRIALIAVLAFSVAFCIILISCSTNGDNSSATNDEAGTIMTSSEVSSEASSGISEEPSEEPSQEASEELSETPSAEPEPVPEIKAGYGVYIDGCFIAAVESENAVSAALQTVLDARSAALGIDENAAVSFINEITVNAGEYPVENFSADLSLCISEQVTDYSGAALPVTLSVKSVVTYSENVIIEHSTKTVYTDSMADGAKDVVIRGYDGEATETYEVISVNGVETERNVISHEVISEAVEEFVYVGTRSDGIDVAAVVNFQKPYEGDGVLITSYMGARWGTLHKGIDIARNGGCYRDPAYAAADGVVINAGDSGNGYGNCVIIDHGDGVTTLYAHFDSCSVKVGDIVKAGDEVGLIGSTGNSTGPHLHFEVRIDDEPVNPLMFVDYE